MALSRRRFSALSTGFLGAGLLTRSAAWAARFGHVSADTWFEWKRVAAGAWVGMGEGGNSLAVGDAGQWVLVDTKNPGFADALRREGSAVVSSSDEPGTPPAKLVRVINTHHHADHTGGNYGFAGTTTILAHVNAAPRIQSQLERYKERLRAVPSQVGKSEKDAAKQVMDDAAKVLEQIDAMNVERFMPSETVGNDFEQTLGSRRIALRHFGAGHTDNDLVVHIPELNLVHTGDLLFNGRHPFVDAPGGANSTGWIASLNRIVELCNERTVVVPGHGDVTDVEGVRKQIAYFEAARKAVQGAIANGATRDAAQQLEISGFTTYGDQGKGRVLAAIFDELKGAPK